jgi:Putative Ig domain
VRLRPVNRGVLLVFLATTCIAGCYAVQAQQSLEIAVQSPQTIVAGENLTLHLVANGGFSPYTWSIDGQLPPGLKLHRHAGTITGPATTPGEYHFKLAVTDSDIPHQQIQRDITIIVVAGITLDWKQPPAVQGSTISGSAVVANQTGHPLDLTVIIVAVNGIGRATALGYQHFTLEAQTSSAEIPFSATPGPETYYVRADVAAHRGRHMYKASKQTENNLQVTQF